MNYRGNFQAIYVMVDKNITREDELINTAFDIIESESSEICDIDVMWHGLHYLLTDVVDFEESTNPLSGVIYGFEVLEDSNELFCSHTSVENMETLVDNLGDVDTVEVLAKFSKESFIKNKITPFKLFKTEDEEFIYDELYVSLDELTEFYYNAYEKGKGVVCIMANFEE